MQTFTFRAARALSSIRTVEAPPPAQGRPAGLGRLARRPDRPRIGRPGAVRPPEDGRTRTRGAPAVHQAGRSDAQRPGNAFPCGKARRHRSAGGPGRLPWAWLSMCSLICASAPLASQGRRRPGCNKRMAVQGRAGTFMAGLEAVLDRGGTAGKTAAPPRCGRLDIQHVPRPAQRA